MSTEKAHRLFVGVPVSLEVVRELTDVARRLRRDVEAEGARVRWVAPATYHVTLAFLGWTRPEAVDAIRDAVRASALGREPFRFVARGIGAFPSAKKARVLWAGVDDARGGLTELAHAVEGCLRPLGFEPDRRGFHPHVTLGRVKTGSADLETLLERFSAHVFSETRVDSVVLYESVMKTEGSEYERVFEAGLESSS